MNILGWLITILLVTFPGAGSACILHSVIKESFSNGKAKVVIDYCGDIKEYEYHYHKNGELKLQKSYFGNPYIGSWKSFDSSGSKVSEGNFIINENEDLFTGELFDGVYAVDYPDGSPRLRIPFSKGYVNGKWMAWHENGQRYITEIRWMRNRVVQKAYFSETGKLIHASAKIGDYLYTWKYDEYGRVIREDVSFKRGNSTTRHFTPDGRILEEYITFPNSLKLSSRSFFGELRNGDEKRRPNHSSSQGFVDYYENGNIRLSGQVHKSRFLKKPERAGRWQWFYEDAIPKRIVDYDLQGRVDGLFKEWHANGQVARQVTFGENGSLSDLVEYDSAGALIRTIPSRILDRDYQVTLLNLENYEMLLVIEKNTD